MHRQAVSAALWVVALFVCMGLVLAAAAGTGHDVAFDLVPTLKAVGIGGAFGMLALIGMKAAPRPALVSAAFLLLWIGGVAGGIITMVGQTFGLPLIDPWLAAADSWLGLSSKDVVGMIVAVPFAARALYSIYFFSVVVLFLTGIALACLRRTERLWEFCAAYAFCLLTSTLCSAIFPAAGAFEQLGIGDTYGAQLPYGSGIYHLTALKELRAATSVLINPFGLQGLVTFPSFHTSMALMTAAAWRGDRYLHWPMMLWNAVVILSTVPIGGHYLVDLIAGALLWLAVFRYGPAWADRVVRWTAGWRRVQADLPAPVSQQAVPDRI
jgi:membrane-associated phospholipid phosphatase